MASSTLAKRNARNQARRLSPHKMQYHKQRGIWLGSNVSFDPTKAEARSYNHWVFAMRLDGVVVFNSNRYSPTTTRHQSKVLTLMQELGIGIDVDISTSHSLHSSEGRRMALIVVDQHNALIKQTLALVAPSHEEIP